MMPVQPNNIRLGLARLKRHYELCLTGYDEVSLLDLAHTLRLWVDMQNEVYAYTQEFTPTLKFVKHKMISKLHNSLDNKMPYLVVSLGDGIDVGIMRFSQFVQINKKMPGEVMFNGFATEKTDFKVWLGAEAARINFIDSLGQLQKKIINRSTMITRVANTMGGSHPVGMPTDNQFNEAVNKLLDWTVGGTVPADKILKDMRYKREDLVGSVTLAYLILMKIAKDILDVFSIDEVSE